LRSGKPFSVLYAIEKNEWRGKVTVQLNIKDFKPGIADVLEGDAHSSLEKASV
jgi:hypothetical protein